MPESSEESSINDLYYIAVSDPDFEADLTVNEEEGKVTGRVGATDGRVFLIEEAPDGSGHVWIEVNMDQEDEEEGEGDTVEMVGTVTVLNFDPLT